MSDAEKLTWLLAIIACPFTVLVMPQEVSDDPRTDEERLSDEEIVRCRDCVHFTANDEFWLEPPQVPFSMIGATCDSCDFWAGTKCKVAPDGFCAWGERKEEQMSEMKDREIEIGIGVDTAELDEAIEKTGELAALTQDVVPLVSIRHLRGCTVNVYVSRNTWTEDGGAE